MLASDCPLPRPLTVAMTLALLVAAGCAARVIDPIDGGDGPDTGAARDMRPPPPDRKEAGVPDPKLCGNGKPDPNESCDDGNRDNRDGCNQLCQVEPGWTCPTFGQLCDPPVCGDGLLASNESCDDGNTKGGDGCSADCQTVEDGWLCRAPGRPCVPLCGDGQLRGGETCDDHNQDNDDGCSSNCLLEPGWDCSQKPCVKSVCGNKKVEPGESCDEGDSSMPGGKNGLFYGDGTGCSKTCTKEPKCRDDTPQHRNRACDAVCGNGNLDAGEECDDGNSQNGDGCSDHCTREEGFACTEMQVTDSQPCASGQGNCLKLPIIYRDFKNETQVGGHPDFFFLGGRSVVAPTTGQLRSCMPNSGGSHRKMTSGDSTARCWGIAADDLNNGKPEYRAGATSATTFNCPCQFSDWSLNNSGAHLGGGYTSAMSPINALPDNGGQSGVKSWSSIAAGTTGVPLVTNGTTFGQWYKDDTGFSTKTQGVLELSDIGGNQFRFSSADDVITGGFFPLDANVAANSETLLCNLWPYWFTFPRCVGDQYLFPPSQGVTMPQGAWVTSVTGHPHDFYFSTEVHYLFVFTPPLQLKFYGDDDLFIFINGKLVLDLGGIHQRLPGQVDVGTDGDATVIEGGILNPTTGNIDFSYLPDPANPANVVTLTQPDDYRMRKVSLGLQPGRIYEIAVFHADRAPTESNYQLTLSGFATKRSVCEAHCGDGIRSGAEECDCGDGPDNPGRDPSCDGPNQDGRYGGCTTQCRLGPFCGDAVTNGPEECDIGKDNGVNLDRDTGCTVKCTFPPYCGDGRVDVGEACDAGENNGVLYPDKPSCATDCTIYIP